MSANHQLVKQIITTSNSTLVSVPDRLESSELMLFTDDGTALNSTDAGGELGSAPYAGVAGSEYGTYEGDGCTP